MTLWKHVERKIAEIIGGKRVPITGRTRGSTPDIEHEFLSIEVKHRKKIPNWIHDAFEQALASMEEGDIPIVVLHEKYMKYEDSFVIIRLKDFMEIINNE